MKNGIAEIQTLDSSLVSELNIAPGDIYWEKLNAKQILLYQAGEFFCKTKLQKFFERGTKLVYTTPGNKEHQLQLDLVLKKFLSAELESQRLKYRQEFLVLIKTYYWDSSEESSLLDLVLVFDQHFNKWASENTEFLLSRPDMHKRNALIATLHALGAILLSYNHAHYLEDLYNITFLVDYSYQKTMTPKVFELLDFERTSLTEFQKAQEHLSQNEREAFQQHSLEDYNLAVKKYSHLFHYSSALSFLKRHHELINGEGAPRRVNQEELSDIEQWGLFVTKLFSQNDLPYDTEKSHKILQNAIEKDLAGRRITRLVSQAMHDSTFEESVA